MTSTVREHYIARWGVPTRTAAFKIGAIELDVYKWDQGATTEGVALYATAGASGQPMGEHSRHRVEFFVGLRPEKDDVAQSLAALAAYPAIEGVALNHGDTVPSDDRLWSGTEMRRFLILRQQTVLPPLANADGDHVEFLQAIPIFEAEMMFKATNGADALIEMWKSAGVAFWDPNRKPGIR